MHLHSFKVRNLKLFEELEWRLDDPDKAAGWHVLIGDNGSGKSALLRALALALMGPQNVAASRADLDAMITRGQGEMSVELELGFELEHDSFAEGGRPPKTPPVGANLTLERQTDEHRNGHPAPRTTTSWRP